MSYTNKKFESNDWYHFGFDVWYTIENVRDLKPEIAKMHASNQQYLMKSKHDGMAIDDLVDAYLQTAEVSNKNCKKYKQNKTDKKHKKRFGLYDPFNRNEWEMHRAIDIAPHDAQEGHELFSMIDGIVIGKGYADDYGYYIIIQSIKHPEFKFRYAHMQRATSLVLGEEVSMKQMVGYLGHTGRSSGPHVHIEFMENNERFNPELVFSFD